MPRLYRCAAGKPTIGYGHVVLAGEAHLLTAVLTEAEASALLRRDVDATYGAHVARRLTRPVTQNQFDALVSLCYNIGTAGFDKSSVLLITNAGTTSESLVRRSFGLWNKVTNPKTGVKEVSKGLTLRRSREAGLFLKP